MWTSLKKMVRVEWILFKLSAIADLQVSVNLGIQFINDILWYSLQIILFESLYLHVNDLGGWTVVEMRVFLGILFLVDALQMIFFAHNFDLFSEKTMRKELDLLLLRPISPQLMMTAQRLQCGYILNAIFAFAWLIWSLTLLPGGFPWSRIPFLLIIIPSGLAVFYSTRLLASTVALLLTRAEHFISLYYTFFRMGTRPDRLYGPGLRYFILLVFPVGMIASFPTRALVEPSLIPLIWVVLGALLSLFVTNRFWNFAVKRYMIMG
jgi:ABC-2 type transport system permease protein